jgi:hypothetical protein
MNQEEVEKKYFDRHPGNSLALTIRNTVGALPLAGALSGQGQALPLQQRALMFFPSNFSLPDLEKVLTLPGYEKEGEIHLQIPEGFEYAPAVKMAAENVNGLDIRDPLSKKLRIVI